MCGVPDIPCKPKQPKDTTACINSPAHTPHPTPPPTMDGEDYTPDEGRSVPPLKIKLPPREKSKRSSSKRKGVDYDESALAADDDDFIDNTSASTSSSSRSKSKRSSERTKSSAAPPVEEPPVNPTPPTRRSERIFVSATKKVSEVTEEEEDADEEYSSSNGNNGTSNNNNTAASSSTASNNNNSSKDVIDFKIIHKDYCQGCRQGGELILCDYCPRAYHKVCIDDEIDEIPDDWCCPHCTKNGKPDPKELREQQAALAAKKKKKQKDYEAKQKAAAASSSSSNSAGASTSKSGSSGSKPPEIENRDYCEICNQVGELLLCDTCPRAYHLICMDMAAAPSGNWSCPHCDEHGIDSAFSEQQAGAAAEGEKVEKAEKIVCKGCRQQGGDIVFCATCPARYHIHCMNPPLDEVPETWHCLACSVEPLKGKVQRIITWRWKKAVVEGADGEKALSAEDSTKNLLKNLKNRKPREREFFCKWKDMSYWHCSWVDEGQLQVFHQGMHRNFVQKNDMNNPPVFDEGGAITTDVPHEAEVAGVEGEEGMSEYLRGISSSNTVKHRRRKRASCLPAEVEESYVRYGIKPDWLLIHRLINHRKSRGKLFYVIKWRELAYDEVTVEAEPDNCEFPIPDYKKKVDEYWALRRTVEEEHAIENDKASGSSSSKRKDKDDKRKSKDKKGGGSTGLKARGLGSAPKSDPKKKWEVQPDYIPEPLKLHEYQKEGINWLRFSWANGIDTILADEMGLGKTIQTVVFLYSLYKEGHTRGPFLIAAPLSTIINWERELEDWCPDFYTVNYTGLKESRIIIRENELSFDPDATRSSQKAMKLRKNAPVKFHVLLTSYELINSDHTLLGSIDWKVLVVDEAHRLKSSSSLFFRTLNAYNVGHKLLLTGTPLQNNLEELFNLLNFLSPNRFNDMEGFLSEFSDIAKEEQVKKLHDLLGAHLLRRLKADVLSGMPAKSEFILRVDLAPQQKKYYKYILTRNFDALNSKGGGKQVSLLNIVMDLKKCCNHPYLFPVAAEEAPKTKLGYFDGGPLVKACGKLIVLQKMLRKLKNDGNRVLIFSQMTQMLDILEDFLDAEGYKFERIDGSITGSVRQEAIDRFNAPGAQQFVFLLSTRAGGLGINLATADTVIIYDSDWNPHNDIQALSRAHRIGQTNKVMIYRFVTRNSVEERITQVAKKKMMLTHLVVRPGLGSKTTNATMSKQELDDILRFGTEELFKEEEGGKEGGGSEAAIHYDDKAIEELLDRSNEGIEQKEMWADEYMSSFKVASYQTKEAEEEEEEEVEEVKETKEEPSQDPHYWEKLLGIHYIQYQDNISRTLGKGKRVRKQVNYMDSASGQHEFQNADTSESSDFSMPSDMSENDEDFDERLEGIPRGNQKALRKSTKEKMPPLVSTVGSNTEVLGFTPKHRKLFLDLVMRFGLPNLENSIVDSQFCVRELKTKPEKHLRAYASLFISHLCEPGDPSATTFEDGVPKEGLNVGQVLTRIGIISLIRRKVFEYQLKHGTTSLKVVKKKAIAPAPTNSVEDDDDDVIEITPKPAENGEKKGGIVEEEDDDVVEITPKPAENGDVQAEKKDCKEEEDNQKSSTAAAKDDEAMEVDEKTVEEAKNDDEEEKKDAEVVKKEEESEDVEMEDADKKDQIKKEEVESKEDVKMDVKDEEEEEEKMDVKKEEADSKESSANATENEDSQQSQQSTAKSEGSSSVKEEDVAAAAAAAAAAGPSTSAAASTSNGVDPKLAAASTSKKAAEEVVEVEEEAEEEVTEVKEFDFIIQDGGLTELHTLWYFEEKELKPKREHEIWNRRHDYWMMAGLVKHGYEQWDAIASDEDFLIVSEPFRSSPGLRNKFMERRLRLLEQALVFEEQLRRYNHLKEAPVHVEKPKEEVVVVAPKEAEVVDGDKEDGKEEEAKDQEMKEDGADADAADGEEGKTNGDASSKVESSKKKENGEVSKKLPPANGDVAEEDKENNEEAENGGGGGVNGEDNLILNPQIQRAANQLEDLLIDMKSDCARIPQTVQRIPSIANRLQLHGPSQQQTNDGGHGHGHGGHHSQSQSHGHPQQHHHQQQHHQQQAHHHPRPTVHHAGSSRGSQGGSGSHHNQHNQQQPLGGMPQSMLNRMM